MRKVLLNNQTTMGKYLQGIAESFVRKRKIFSFVKYRNDQIMIHGHIPGSRVLILANLN